MQSVYMLLYMIAIGTSQTIDTNLGYSLGEGLKVMFILFNFKK
jgi:hypothetical protein